MYISHKNGMVSDNTMITMILNILDDCLGGHLGFLHLKFKTKFRNGFSTLKNPYKEVLHNPVVCVIHIINT